MFVNQNLVSSLKPNDSALSGKFQIIMMWYHDILKEDN